MISAIHLVWIIPTCVVLGAMTLAFFMGASQNNKEYEAYQQGLMEGSRIMGKHIEVPLAQTLEELFDRGFESDFYKFKETTGGIIYEVQKSSQLCMVFIDNVEELGEYYQNKLIGINDEGSYQRPIIKAK
jgi:hypothetical protein